MYNEGLKNIVESIIFASEEEITIKGIKEILTSFRIETDAKEIQEIIDALNDEYTKNENAFEIIKIAGGFQFATKKKFAHFIGKLYTETQKKKLSPPAIETLSIIAYKQPITRNDIEFVRGVNVDYIVNSLLERDLITITGRGSGPGRPILYGTTTNFLKVLGLNSIEDLPKLKEINEILKTEKIEGITEADIDLFNSVNAGITNDDQKLEFQKNDSPLENNAEEESKVQISEEHVIKDNTEILNNEIEKKDGE